jgi:hypothetical protein
VKFVPELVLDEGGIEPVTYGLLGLGIGSPIQAGGVSLWGTGWGMKPRLWFQPEPRVDQNVGAYRDVQGLYISSPRCFGMIDRVGMDPLLGPRCCGMANKVDMDSFWVSAVAVKA